LTAPFFSIVMPTRNRAHLLQYSLQSALRQRFDDYEVLVSDNCSQDRTPNVAKELSSPIVRYIRTDRPLSMSDSWEFALEHARGQYVTVLCDDDAVLPRFLSTVAAVIDGSRAEVVTWSAGSYFHDSWYQPERRNTAELLNTSGRVYPVKSRIALKDWFFELWPSLPTPKMLQSCCSRRVIERIKERCGRLFLSSCPDVSVAILTLSEVKAYDHVDRVLMLSGSARESTGASAWHNQRSVLRAYAAEFEDGHFKSVPLKILAGINFVTETLVETRQAVWPRLADFEVNWERYFVICYLAMATYAKAGVNIAEERREFDEALSKYPPDFRERVFSMIRSSSTPTWRRLLRGLLDASPALSRLESLLRGARTAGSTVIRGERAGFKNILECVQAVDAMTPSSPLELFLTS